MKKLNKNNWIIENEKFNQNIANFIDDKLMYENGKEEEYFLKLQEKLWNLKKEILGQISMIDKQ